MLFHTFSRDFKLADYIMRDVNCSSVHYLVCNKSLFHRDTTSVSKNQISKDMEDKIIKLMEIFPQKSKKDLLEVKSPSLM